MSQRPTSRFLSRLRSAAADDRGASNAMLLLGAVVVFGIVSVSFGGGLLTAMTTMQQQKVNTALAGQVATVAMKEANRGFPVVSTLPATSDITIKVGGAEVSAQRIITVNAGEQTAEVLIRAGRYIHGGFADPSECDDAASSCVAASEVATSSLSQTFPDTEGVNLIDQSSNVPASNEIVWKDAAVGATTIVAIDGAGSLWSWGTNASGEAGLGSTGVITTPTKITSTGASTFTHVAAGSTTMYAIDSAGKLWTWGSDSSGQLGNGAPTANVTKPTKVDTSRSYRDVAASADTACAVTLEGGMFCWGASATINRTTPEPSSTPVQVYANGDSAQSNSTQFSAVSVGAQHKVALDTSGDVYTWGTNSSGQLGTRDVTTPAVPARVKSDKFNAAFTSIAAGGENTFAVDSYGRLYGWGGNANGVLGDGSTTQRTEPIRIASDLLFRDIAVSGTNAYGVTRDGGAYAWGRGDIGGIGDGKNTARLAPTPVGSGAAFIQITTSPNPDGGSSTTWALDTTHRLWAWGTATAGAWGDGASTANARATAQQNRIRSGGGVTVTQVAAGANHTAALGADGTIWSWGLGTSGQLGNGGTSSSSASVKAAAAYSDQPTGIAVGSGFILTTGKLGRLTGAGIASSGELGAGNTTQRNAPTSSGSTQYSDVASGASHSVAIVRDTGAVVAWGKNQYGQVGNGSTNNSTGPTAVKGLPASKIVDVVAGGAFSAALDIDGNVWTWGRNDLGQLGIGNATDATSAVRVLIDAKIVTIAAGDAHMLAVDDAGNTWAWGANANGQLGTGTSSDKLPLPVKITTPAPLVEVAANATASFGVTAAGKLVSWGGATDADSGHGTAATKKPAEIASAASTSFRDVNAAADQAFAIDVDGNLWGWGTNTGGELGRATTTAPTKFALDKKVVAVATSATNSAFTTADGKVYATGLGANGQLGQSSTTPVASFTEVPAWGTATQANVPSYAKNGTTWLNPTFMQVSAGGNTTAGVDVEGHLWLWGAGTSGQLGGGGTGNASAPQMVASSVDFSSVKVGGTHVVALATDGTVWTFGASSSGANGRTVSLLTPTRAPIAAPIADIAASNNHTVALAVGGNTLFGWGQNTAGQLGVASSAARTLPATKALSAATGITAGDGFTVVLDSTSKASVLGAAPWGSSANPFTSQYADIEASGAIVIGTQRIGTNNVQTYGIASGGAAAASLITITNSMFTNADAGSGHVVALDVNGTVWTWGANGNGQLGRDGAAGSPALLPVVGDPSRKVFTPQEAPALATTTWKIATIDEGTSGTVQVNVNAGMPLLSVVVLCADGTRKQMAAPANSSGDYSYANLNIDDLSGCDSPTIAAILNGAPSSAADVKTVIVPLVYASEVADRW